MDKLPLEIIARIFSYLPITDTWRLRRIARLWQYNLSSSTIIGNAIQRHESHDPGDSAFPPATNNNEELSRRQQLLKNHYLASPLPSYTFTFNPPYRNSSTEESVKLRAFKGEYFAMTIESPDRIFIKNLRTGQAFAIHGIPSTRRNPIRTLCLTEDLIAYSSDDTLFTMRLDELGQINHARRSLQDPRFVVYHMTGHKEKILILWRPGDNNTIALTIYEHDLDRYQRFDFDQTELGIIMLRSYYMLVDNRAQAYHLFSTSNGWGDEDMIRYSLNHVVISFEGDVILRRTHDYAIEQRFGQDFNDEQPLSQIVSVGIPHVYHLCVATTWHTPLMPTHHLLLNLEQWTDIQISVYARANGKSFAFWKSMSFESLPPPTGAATNPDSLSSETAEELAYASVVSSTDLTISRMSPDLKRHEMDVASIWPYKSSKTCPIIWVNDSFLVWTTRALSTQEQVCHVFVFDDRVTEKTTRPLLNGVERMGQDSPPVGTLLWKHRSVKA